MSSLSDQHRDLEAELAQRNDLIAALTAQLEKAVNQLDRLRRAGADRAPSAPARPGESSELASRLTSVLDDWSEFQPSLRIERIEHGIERILEMLDEQRISAATASAPPAPQDYWEQAKTRLLAENPPEGNSPPVTAAAAMVEPPRIEPDSFPAALDELPSPVPGPAPVPADAPPETLWDAIETRDQYIQYLITRMRTIESQKYLTGPVEQLFEKSGEQGKELQALDLLLRERLRQAEIAHSLERAVLARERAKLSQVRQHLEAELKRMENQKAASLAQRRIEVPEDSPPQRGDSESRWKRLFSR